MARPKRGRGAVSLRESECRYRRRLTKTYLKTVQLLSGQAAETSENRVCKRELHSCLNADKQFVTNFTQIKCQTNLLPKKRVNYDKLRFPTKQGKLYFHIINIHTQGYITLYKYIIGIAIIGLPNLNLWETKCLTERP